MRGKVKLLAIIVSLLVLAALSAKAGTDPNVPDTVFVDSVRTPTSNAVLTVRFVNDEPLAGIEVTLHHNLTPSLLVLDSVSFIGSRVAYLTTKYLTRHTGSNFTVSAFVFSEPLIPAGNGLLCKLYYSISVTIDSALATIDSTTVSPAPDVYYTVQFSDANANWFYPKYHRGHLYLNRHICCIGNMGNVDGDINDQVTILDLTYLVNRLFRGGPAPICPGEANLDYDPNVQITIVDLTLLIDFIFRAGPAPRPCQ